MMQRIMVPLDGSTFSESALSTAFRLARRHGSTVHLVRVHEPKIPVAGPEGPPLYDPVLERELEEKGRRYLEVMRAWTNGDDRAHAITAYLYGPVTECLTTYVRNEAIDLVVMTTHARGGVSRALLGSVADGLVRLPEATRARHARFLRESQLPDGSFPDRDGGADLYYTGFGLRGLAALDAVGTFLKNPDYVVKVLLHGLSGPLDGTTYPDAMIAMGMQSDEWIASIGSFVRNSFGNRSAFIQPADVARLRAATASRKTPWTTTEVSASLPRVAPSAAT